MTRNLFWNDDRGVSIATDHALGLLILLTLSGVFIGGLTTISEDREEATTEQELERISDEVVTGLLTADDLAENTETRVDQTEVTDSPSVQTRTTLPSSIGGAGYSVSISDSNTDDEVTVTTQSQGIVVERTVTVKNEVQGGGTSDDLIFEYDGEEITMRGIGQ